MLQHGRSATGTNSRIKVHSLRYLRVTMMLHRVDQDDIE